MKLKHLLLVLVALISLLILTSCVQEKIESPHETALPPEEVVESEAAIEEIIEETDEVAEEEQPVAESQSVVREITINMLRTKFGRDNVVISPDTFVNWKNIDDRVHQVACYIEGERVYKSEQIKPEDNDSYIFTKTGDYRCMDVVFGYWTNITVSSGNQITGHFVYPIESVYSYASKIGIIVMIMAFLSLYGLHLWKKRQN